MSDIKCFSWETGVCSKFGYQVFWCILDTHTYTHTRWFLPRPQWRTAAAQQDDSWRKRGTPKGAAEVLQMLLHRWDHAGGDQTRQLTTKRPPPDGITDMSHDQTVFRAACPWVDEYLSTNKLNSQMQTCCECTHTRRRHILFTIAFLTDSNRSGRAPADTRRLDGWVTGWHWGSRAVLLHLFARPYQTVSTVPLQ